MVNLNKFGHFKYSLHFKLLKNLNYCSTHNYYFDKYQIAKKMVNSQIISMVYILHHYQSCSLLHHLMFLESKKANELLAYL